MKRVIAFLTCLFMSLSASAQFTNGQVLTAPALNAALAGPTITSGTINGSTIGNSVPKPGTFTTLNATSTTTGTLSLSGSLTLGTPLSVPNGGTGQVSLTNHGVLIGAGTTAITQSAVGTTGQMLLGVSGGDPVWGNNPTITGGTVDNAAVGSGTPSTGAFTTLSASSTVSGAGFTSRFASPGPIGNTSASTGAFTTITASSTITPNSVAGIVGTITNDSAQAGSNGEYITATTAGTSISTGTVVNATSTPLTAGDWDVECTVTFVPAGSTTISLITAGINTVSATLPAANTGGYNSLNWAAGTAGNSQSFTSPVVRVALSGTTTTYCLASSNFAVSTMTVSGFMRARRVR